jgi:hypothetical protein
LQVIKTLSDLGVARAVREVARELSPGATRWPR